MIKTFEFFNAASGVQSTVYIEAAGQIVGAEQNIDVLDADGKVIFSIDVGPSYDRREKKVGAKLKTKS